MLVLIYKAYIIKNDLPISSDLTVSERHFVEIESALWAHIITVTSGDDRPTNPVFLYFTLNFYLDWFP